MKTELKYIAPFLAFSAWADEVYGDEEKAVLVDVAEVLGFNSDEFVAAVEDEIEAMKDMSGEDVTKHINEAGSKVADDEVGTVIQAAMETIFADCVIVRNEMTNLLVIANALGIEEEDVILMVADMVKEEPEMEIRL